MGDFVTKPPTGALPLDPTGGLPSPRLPPFAHSKYATVLYSGLSSGFYYLSHSILIDSVGDELTQMSLIRELTHSL